MNRTGTTYTEAELQTGLTAHAAEEDFDPLLTGMADRAMTQGRRLVRHRRITAMGASLAIVAIAASAAMYARPGRGGEQSIPPAAGTDTVGATAVLAYNATCFDGPVAQPSMTTYAWNPVTKQYAKTAAGPTMTLSPDGKLALLQTGITPQQTTSYAVAPWADVAAGRIPAAAYRQLPAQVSLTWTTDGKALINQSAGRDSTGPRGGGVDFYDSLSFAKTTVPFPQAVLDLINPARADGAWHITDVSGTASDFTVTVVSKDSRQVRVFNRSGQELRNLKLPDVPSHLDESNETNTALSPDGRYLALWGNPGLAVYDLATQANRLVFHTERGAVPVDGKPHLQNFDYTGWTSHDQLLGIVRWSTSGHQESDVHQQIKLLTPYGDEVDSVDIAVPGDAKRVCSAYIATTGPAEEYPSAIKV